MKDYKYKIITYDYKSLTYEDGKIHKIEICDNLYETNSKLIYLLTLLYLKIIHKKYDVVKR